LKSGRERGVVQVGHKHGYVKDVTVLLKQSNDELKDAPGGVALRVRSLCDFHRDGAEEAAPVGIPK